MSARDRMAEFISLVPLHREWKTAPRAIPNGSRASNNDNNVETGGVVCFSLPENDETRPIFDDISKIRQQREALEALHIAYLMELRPEKRELVRCMVEAILSQCHCCQKKIYEYNHTTQQITAGDTNSNNINNHNISYRSQNTAELRMRQNIAIYMESQLMSEVRSVWMAQKEHERCVLDATARRVKARFGTRAKCDGGSVSHADGEIDMEHAREIAQHLLVTGNEDRLFFLAQDELVRVVRTRDAVLELERDMQELLQLFSDLQFLVQGQHEQLVRIQQNVEKGCQNIEQGARHLRNAKKHKKKGCCCSMM